MSLAPLASLTPHSFSQVDLLTAKQNYTVCLQNLRGFMQNCAIKQRSKQLKQGKDPSHIASYSLLAKSSLRREKGLEVLRIVKDEPKLEHLSAKLLESLAAYMHLKLCLHMSAKVALHEEATAVTEAIKQPAEFKPLSRLVVGMSGGADSTLALVLACAMRDKYGYSVVPVHCIHGLDPDDDIWLEHNHQLCEELSLSLRTPVLNINYGGGVSPEDSSRAERYAALLKECAKVEGSCLVLGHQADDQIESFLLALKRGSGPTGLQGMQEFIEDERGYLLRPLLSLHKIELEQVLTSLNYSYVFDLSNNYLKFERNFVRLQVLPLLRERFAGIDKAILRSQKLCAIEHALAQRYIAEHLEKYLEHKDFALFPVFNFKELDLGDYALTTMLLREYFSLYLKSEVGIGIELNLIEQAYELMLKDHDRHGCLEVGKYKIATFLHYLCIYEELSAAQKALCSGRHEFTLDEASLGVLKTLTREQSAQQEPTKLTLATLSLGKIHYKLVCYANEANVAQLLAQTTSEQRLKSKLFKLPTSLLFSKAQGYLVLNFDYANSLKLKAQGVRHSKELKKFMVHYELAPWQRSLTPLLCLKIASEELVLAVGSAFACQIAEEAIGNFVSMLEQDESRGGDRAQTSFVFCALEIC